ncbi:hypothetical protein J5N97_014100 [Dioscorea zingiberensis]|uniref:Uncharacterized protein n=1 Tax=Dioscorea zingiberensis TaxID=325984 RepID=A0A9D5CS00_9LILI|nr:hypothetical protein J5N97_014100 [Dioscorea zingiberensis]
MMKIIKDASLESIEDGSLALDKSEFVLGSVINAFVSQVMLLLRERGLQLIRDIPEEIKTICWVEIQVWSNLKQNSDEMEIMLLHFRIVVPGDGLPRSLSKTCFTTPRWTTQERSKP